MLSFIMLKLELGLRFLYWRLNPNLFVFMNVLCNRVSDSITMATNYNAKKYE